MELLTLTEEEAEKRLKSGEISAYAILPENFVERAMKGDVDTVTYVTSASSKTLAVLFKNEITKLITDIVVYNEKGIYAVHEAVKEQNPSVPTGKYTDLLAIRYVDLVLSRGNIYSVEELGISSGVGMVEYYVCALSVAVLFLLGIAFCTLYAKRDPALGLLLCSKGYSRAGQVVCEFLAHITTLILLVAAVFGLMFCSSALLPTEIFDFFTEDVFWSFAVRLVPVVLTAGAFNLFVFELAPNLVSGMIMHFFLSLAQFYLSGCLYPVYALPETLGRTGGLLPCGLARGYLEGAFTGESGAGLLLGLAAYILLFLALTLAARYLAERSSVGLAPSRKGAGA
jgi:hypothetical protein